ncbi:aminotransferase class I/II-fold pyridoxal phosphate-dependent enzyme [Paenibacillus agricola]|uniref:Aminotransferase class I/II-fold pyridoxal phosphate-dependent enzyme n=1 Tax=Paenibacillus agricola TaxID=2716264 RepID=A0ABX0JHP8_9BACL|nr:aminotransferase class I/II-fold pyridoxal phosphate-dependent enzyme [Paenibacillus agricola]NHN35103.1 aminotransferase class I/II-fold pyridoxal phosphate-dependent enzyme [Paenibacillus agricola]
MKRNKHHAPLFEQLVEHAGKPHASLHVPGHKSGQGLDKAARPYYETILRLDLTEISGLDDLHHPEEAILEAQQLAADCFGAEESFFLVNGSTVGNLAMILSVCRRGELLLVQRDAHKSVIHGLILAGAQAVFINPEVDPATGMTLGLRLEAVEEALNEYPSAKGLLLTRPSYYGVAGSLQAIVELLHSHGKPLLVDEAHGAHLGFHPALPQSALSYGADCVVQSTHKLLTAMTMGAMLHVQGDLVGRKELKRYLTMLQSSSPSYPLMASLDLSRRQMHMEGSELLSKGLAVVEKFKHGMQQLKDFMLLEPRMSGDIVCIFSDPFKVTLKVSRNRLSGFELKDALEDQGCFVEMADPQAVLLVFSLASTDGDVHRLLQALELISRNIKDKPAGSGGDTLRGFSSTVMPGLSKPVSFDESVTYQQGAILVALEESAGLVSAEMVVPYPPGIPALCPGERISAEVTRYLMQLVAMGARIHGLVEGEPAMISVFSAPHL